MLCPNCQTEMYEQANFCGVCGKPMVAPASAPAPIPTPQWAGYVPTQPACDPYQQQRQAVRDSELRALEQASAYFLQKQGCYNAYDNACKKIKYYGRGAKSALLVWGAIVATLGIMFTILANSTGDEDVAVIFACLLLIPGIAMIVGGVLMKVANAHNLEHWQKEYITLANELHRHYCAYPYPPVGIEYTNPQALAAIRRILQSGRADTIKEALQCLIAGTNQRAIYRYLDDILRHTAQIAAQERVSNVILAAYLFR